MGAGLGFEPRSSGHEPDKETSPPTRHMYCDPTAAGK